MSHRLTSGSSGVPRAVRAEGCQPGLQKPLLVLSKLFGRAPLRPHCSALLAPEGPQLVRWRSGEADRPCECFGARIPTAPLALAARHGVPSCLAIGRPREQHFVVWGP